MGKASIKEDKTYYQICREECGFTRESAIDHMAGMSGSRLENIEYKKMNPAPEDVLLMADGYKRPDMINYYCSHDCAIGQMYVPKVKMSSLAEITVGILSSLNAIEKDKDRFVDIVADGEITDDELEDFARIENKLEEIALSATSLEVWMKKKMIEGGVDSAKYEEIKASLKK